MQKLHPRGIQQGDPETVLVTRDGVAQWMPVEDIDGVGPLALDDLSDVSAAAPTDGQVVMWDVGTAQWVAGTPAAPVSGIDDLTDVDTTTTAPEVGDTLVWDGANWVPSVGPRGLRELVTTVIDGEPALLWVAVGDSFELLYAGV